MQVRLSTMKALPDDEEVGKAGYQDAGEFLMNLQQFPTVFERFMRDHAAYWDEAPLPPLGPRPSRRPPPEPRPRRRGGRSRASRSGAASTT